MQLFTSLHVDKVNNAYRQTACNTCNKYSSSKSMHHVDKVLSRAGSDSRGQAAVLPLLYDERGGSYRCFSTKIATSSLRLPPRTLEGTSLAVTQRPVIGGELNVIFT